MVHKSTADGVLTCGGDLHAVRAVLTEEIITSTAPRAARVFKDPTVVNWKFAIRPIPIDMNTVVVTSRANTQVLIGTGTSAPQFTIDQLDFVFWSNVPHDIRDSRFYSRFVRRYG